MILQDVRQATDFGFEVTSLESWTELHSNTEVPMPTPGVFRSAEPFMVGHIIKSEVTKVLSDYKQYEATAAVSVVPEPFETWIIRYVLEGVGPNLHQLNPMNNSTSLMANLEAQLRAAFWVPIITRVAEEVAAGR